MLKLLERFLKPPQLGDSEKQAKAELLHRLLLGLIGLDLLICVASLLIHPDDYVTRIALYILAFVVFAFLYALNQRGYTDLTAVLFTISLFGLVVIAILLTHRSSFAEATGFLVVVYCAGLLVSRRAALMTTVAAGVLSAFMIFSLYPTDDVATSEKLYLWLIYLGFLSAGTILLYLVLESLEKGQTTLKERAVLLDKIADAVIATTMEGKF
jgi:hypothetical protein